MKTSTLKCAGIVVAGIAASFLTGCGQKGGMQQAPAPTIATMTVGLSSSESENTFPAQIKGKTDIAIRPQVTGFITKVHVDEGQQVHKGQVLFTLDQVTFQAAVDQAQAAVNSAQTAVNTTQMTVDNKKKLLDKNIISQYEYQLAVNDLATAKAALSQAQAALSSARRNLAYTVVTAPSDGVVGTIPQREGSLASPSSAQPLTTVSDNSEVYAYFSLTEKDLLNLSNNGANTVNQAIAQMPAVKLRLSDGSIYPLEGKVATVSGVIDSSTGAATVRALFNNTNGLLRSGSTGTIIIPENRDSVIVIPQVATFELQDRRFVYLVSDSNKVKSTPVTVTPVSDGRTFVVTSGLNPGDVIAVEGIGTQVREGMVINPVDAAAQQQAAQQQAAAVATEGVSED
ncbi:MAG: efflux RND transporter periplasmic adaptor subunit [Clostridium sp.]|nr:efflux RND transporter periplasmic adaptor subunit [Clostridium sp.]